MQTRTIHMTRIAALALLLISLLATAGATRAQDDDLLLAEPIEGVSLTVWAAAEVEPLSGGGQLVLELNRLYLDSCTAGTVSSDSGPALVLAESGEITIRTGTDDVLLAQGESMLMPTGAQFTVINGNVDRAFGAAFLVLSVTLQGGDQDTSLEYARLDEVAEFPAESFCEEVNPEGLLEGSVGVSAFGRGSDGADTLYLGFGLWESGATTEGYGLVNPGSSFNLLLLTGGMGTAGPTSGRAFQSGPGQLLSDQYLGPDIQITSAPFVNTGEAAVAGLIFGAATEGDPVWEPKEGG